MIQKRDVSAQMSGAANVGPDERALMAMVARMHYIDDRSHVKIAEELGISRFKVARLLDRARDEGLVKITVDDRGLEDPILGERLKARLGLAECYVVRCHGDEATIRSQVGAVAAAVLEKTLAAGDVLGLTWGRSLTATTSQLRSLPRLSIVQLTGSVSGDFGSSPIEIIRQASARSGGAIYPIISPLFIEDEVTAESLRQHHDIRSAIELFPSVTTAVLSVGSWNPPSTQVRDVLAPGEVKRLEGLGVVADIAGILIRDDGTLADPAFQRRCVAISYDELIAVPRVLAVASGPSKAGAILAVSTAGLITSLVTDHELAMSILGTDA